MSYEYSDDELQTHEKSPASVFVDQCYGCQVGLENQLGHMEYGGCLYEPGSFSSDNDYDYDNEFAPSATTPDLFTSESTSIETDMMSSANTVSTDPDMPPLESCEADNDDLPDSLIRVLENNHFIAAFVPWYFNCNDEMLNKLKEARQDYCFNIECGDWVFTPYHAPNDIAYDSRNMFSWEYVFKLPYKYHQYMAESTPIRYGLPIGEEFIKPIKRQYYGHPALFDLANNKPFDIPKVHKKYIKKTYEFNQMRLRYLENSEFQFKNYNISQFL
jgi:hypothetical protein